MGYERGMRERRNYKQEEKAQKKPAADKAGKSDRDERSWRRLKKHVDGSDSSEEYTAVKK